MMWRCQDISENDVYFLFIRALNLVVVEEIHSRDPISILRSTYLSSNGSIISALPSPTKPDAKARRQGR